MVSDKYADLTLKLVDEVTSNGEASETAYVHALYAEVP